jgi:hypothetical protein
MTIITLIFNPVVLMSPSHLLTVRTGHPPLVSPIPKDVWIHSNVGKMKYLILLPLLNTLDLRKPLGPMIWR